ncbi:MAG: hypothetical protein IT518_19855 [Burkholderiales bacterium]|nr:hypothetical protein [Burkholderiales bacterium]
MSSSSRNPPSSEGPRPAAAAVATIAASIACVTAIGALALAAVSGGSDRPATERTAHSAEVVAGWAITADYAAAHRRQLFE